MKKVMVGGVFSVLHPGHAFFLRKAKGLGDFLIVVIASDRTALKKKGVHLRTAEERKSLVEGLGIADRVVIGDDEDRFRVVEREKPDIIALGYDQEIDDNLRERIRKSGLVCSIVRIKERLSNHSSSNIIKRRKKGPQVPNQIKDK